MRSSVSFGIGVIGGAIISSALLLVSSPRNAPSKEAEIASLKADLARTEKVALRDREALRAAQQEREILRQSSPAKPGALIASPLLPTAAPSNSAIASYLGGPVPPPANLDRNYSSAELSVVFRDLAETLGVKVDQLAVDTSEFPFLIHGRVESSAGANFFKKIDSELRALPGYTYGGSVTGGTREGSTYFSLNMTPSSAYPPGQAEAIRRRLMLRLQMAAAAWGDSPP